MGHFTSLPAGQLFTLLRKLNPWWTTLDLQHWLKFQSVLGIKPAVSEISGNAEDSQWCWEVLSPSCVHRNVWALSLYNHPSPRSLQGSFFTLCSPYWRHLGCLQGLLACSTAQQPNYSFLGQQWWTGVAASSPLVDTWMTFYLVQVIAFCKTTRGESNKWFTVNCHMDLTKALTSSSFPAS